jgi:hypothetical protein
MVLPDKSISFNERRQLEELPKLTIDALINGDYMTSLELYLLDHMPFRDKFKSLKVWTENLVFSKTDINGIFLEEDYLLKMEYPYNHDMGIRFVDYINKVKETYLENNNVYVAIIPDKSYFGSDESLKMDYGQLVNDVKMGDYVYIDLFDDLTLESYFKTDPHWRQEKLGPIIDKLSTVMNFEVPYKISDLTAIPFDNFYGAYAGQSSINVTPEEMIYLIHPSFNDVVVLNYEKDKETEVYSESFLMGIDAYDVFLGGASPLIEIVNDNANSDKELILFRDSFSSSLAPLLIGSYKKITLVDTRYVSYEYLENFIEFENQDILFLYSTLVVNNSVMLK